MRRRLSAIFGLVLALVWSTSLLAQTDGQAPDYTSWDRIATGAEQILAGELPADPELETVRSQLANWRERFRDALSVNKDRIGTVEDQIAGLGPAPEPGQPEPGAIAQRRDELTAQLLALQEPGLAAEEAFSRAAGLISEIDTVLRERQTMALMQLGPSPLNPAHWQAAIVSLGGTLGQIGAELGRNWTVDFKRAVFRRNLPFALAFMALGLVLLLRAGPWVDRATALAAARLSGPGARIAGFALSTGRVILPYAGFLALSEAASSLVMLGMVGRAQVLALPEAALVVCAGLWLGRRAFPEGGQGSPFPPAPERLAEARLYAALLGVLLAADILLGRLAVAGEFTDATMAVLRFPIFVVAGLMVTRLGLMLARQARHSIVEDPVQLIPRAAVWLGRSAVLAGAVGPVLAAIGYTQAAEAIVFPSVLTLALFAAVGVGAMVIRDIYALAAGIDDDSIDSALLPVLATLVLGALSLPVLALIWGATHTQLAEVATRLREGVRIGETRIAPADLVIFALVFVIGYGLTRLLQALMRTTVLPRTRMNEGGRAAVTSGIGYVGIFLAAVVAITAMGVDLSNIAIVAGALSVGIGFGLQNIVSNFVAGIILLVERPISRGDWIEVGDHMGIVKDISVRSTRIQKFDRTDVIVPNADFVSGPVTNWTRGNVIGRVTVSVGVAYHSDSRKVEAILREICEAHDLVARDPAPSIYFRSFGADALEFDCYCILTDVNYKFVVLSDINHRIIERFREEDIEIPFSQRDLWLRNPEALPRPAPAPAARRDSRPDDGIARDADADS